MERDTIDLSVLLIQAPVHHPACRPLQWDVAAARLSVVAQHLELFDAGVDFFDKVVMNPDFLSRIADRAVRGAAARRTRGTDFAVSGPIRAVKIETSAGQLIGMGLPETLARLRSADGRQPEAVIDDLEALDFALDLVSAGYYPLRLDRHGCAHPGLNTIEDLLGFRDDPEANPFWLYAFEQWQPFAISHAPDVAVFCVTSAGQIPAAATLAKAWRQRWPDIPLLVIGSRHLSVEERNKLFFQDRFPSAEDELGRLAAQLATIDPAGAVDLPLVGGFQGGSKDLLTGHRAPLEQPLIADRIPEYAQAAEMEGRKLIIWSPGHGETVTVGRQLHAVARKGIWNHLILGHEHDGELEKFALANANIVHSWCRQEPAISPFSDAIFRYPDASSNYGETTPMPGYPLWMALRDPLFIETALEHHDFDALVRMRVRDDGRSLFQVGQNLHYHYVPPTELPVGYLEEIVRMVAAGGSVNTRFVKYNLERAYLIAYAEEEGVIIGNSSLKHPRDEYIDAVSQQSGIDLHDFLERGYTSVRPEYRGLGVGAQLLAGLTERAGDYKIFSVIAEGNIATQKMAIRNRTRRVATFFSQRAQKEVSVWVPEWMLPEGIVLPEQPDIPV